MKLNKERMYEVTEVKKGQAWWRRLDSEYTLVGTIVKIENPELPFASNLVVQKTNGHDYFAVEETIFVQLANLTLRPLNKLDQSIIEEHPRGS